MLINVLFLFFSIFNEFYYPVHSSNVNRFLAAGFSRVAIQSIERKRVLVQADRQTNKQTDILITILRTKRQKRQASTTTASHGVPFGVVSRVGRGINVLDRDGDRGRGRAVFGVNVGYPIVCLLQTTQLKRRRRPDLRELRSVRRPARVRQRYVQTMKPTTSLLLLIQPLYGPLDFVRDYAGAYTRKVNQEGKTNLDLMEQEIVSGSGISWALCKSASRPDR